MKWQKSSYSSPSGNSVEVALRPDNAVLIRESDTPADFIVTTQEKFRAFVKGVKDGEFDHI